MMFRHTATIITFTFVALALCSFPLYLPGECENEKASVMLILILIISNYFIVMNHRSTKCTCSHIKFLNFRISEKQKYFFKLQIKVAYSEILKNRGYRHIFEADSS